MKALQNLAGLIFMGSVSVLTIVAILGIWEIVNNDVIEKSLSTIGILAAVTAVVLVAGRFIDKSEPSTVSVVSPAFASIRKITLVFLIASISLLAFIGVLAIWEIIQDKEILFKTLSTMGLIAFASLVIVVVCMERENHPMLQNKGKQFSAGGIFLVLIFAWMLVAMMSGLR